MKRFIKLVALFDSLLQAQNKMTTATHNISGYKVQFIDFGNGDKRLFIFNPEGTQFYGHRTSGVNYLETAKREIADDLRLAKVGLIEAAPKAERIVVKAEINDGVHTTNEGQNIRVTELSNAHLLAILPKVKYSKRRFQYVREALYRGFVAEVKATGLFSENYAREVRA